MNTLLRRSRYVLVLLAFLLTAGCWESHVESPDHELQTLLARMTLEEKIAQKFIVDFRYFCSPPASSCSERWVDMQPEIRSFLQRQPLAGVILFANNIQDTAQTVRLTHEIQSAGLSSRLGLGFLITTDQEGGNVLRTPRDGSTRLTGNMSIGATYLEHGVRYAQVAGNILGRELAALGINVNHAPVLDVNVNPNNPVINVRSFSDAPEMVGDLGLALHSALQAEGVASTVKHFPGHGDTQVDSHYGLPLVNHDLATVKKVDLYPFQYLFDRRPPDLVMTAHIQYPALDDSTLPASQPKYLGQNMIRPATLSRRILTDLLRGEMGFAGVVVTDAMTMDGIAAFFTPEDAVLRTFAAGADIALMPFSLSSGLKLQEFERLLLAVAQTVRSGGLSETELDASVLRILKLKKKLGLLTPVLPPLENRIAQAQATVGSTTHAVLERELAEQALTLMKNGRATTPLLPLRAEKLQRVTVLANKDFQASALKNSLQIAAAARGNPNLQVSLFNINTLDPQAVNRELSQSQLLIIASDANKVTPAETDSSRSVRSASESGRSTYEKTMAVLLSSGSLVFESEMSTSSSPRLKAGLASRSDQEKVQVMLGALQTARSQTVPSLFVSLAAPYEAAVFAPHSDGVLAIYNGNSYFNTTGKEVGVAYQALCRLILGEIPARGHLPIHIPDLDGKTILFPRGFGLGTQANSPP